MTTRFGPKTKTTIPHETLIATAQAWRDRSKPMAIVASDLGVSQSALIRRVASAIAAGVECYQRGDPSVAAAKWFAGAKKGA